MRRDAVPLRNYGVNLIPYGVLHDGERYVIETYALRYLTSGRELLRNWDLGSESTGLVVAVANPSGAHLPGTTQEARMLQSLFSDVELLIGDNATETKIRASSRPYILHIGTHGFFGNEWKDRNLDLMSSMEDDVEQSILSQSQVGNPMLYSGLELASVSSEERHGEVDDGRLTAYEISGWDLRGTRLVTLSACETGLGELGQGEGVLGLRRAIVLAGANAQAISLWNVSDSATPAVMESFYRNLSRGAGPGEAMQAAQLGMLEDDQYSHPFYWSPFIVSGDWRPFVSSNGLEPIAGRPRGCRSSIMVRDDGDLGSLTFAYLLLFRRRRSRCGVLS